MFEITDKADTNQVVQIHTCLSPEQRFFLHVPLPASQPVLATDM